VASLGATGRSFDDVLVESNYHVELRVSGNLEAAFVNDNIILDREADPKVR
jgi:hypothetical protein